MKGEYQVGVWVGAEREPMMISRRISKVGIARVRGSSGGR